jgi:hypothetical protein
MCMVAPMPSKPRSDDPKTRFQMFLEPDQLDALKRIAERTGAPVAAQIRIAIDAYLAKQRKER